MMSSRNSAGRSVRMASGPFWMGRDCQMIRTSDMRSMPFSTMARVLPRVKPSLMSPMPEAQVIAASYWRCSMAITACSCPPPKPVRPKNCPGSTPTPARRSSLRGTR